MFDKFPIADVEPGYFVIPVGNGYQPMGRAIRTIRPAPHVPYIWGIYEDTGEAIRNPDFLVWARPEWTINRGACPPNDDPASRWEGA